MAKTVPGTDIAENPQTSEEANTGNPQYDFGDEMEAILGIPTHGEGLDDDKPSKDKDEKTTGKGKSEKKEVSEEEKETKHEEAPSKGKSDKTPKSDSVVVDELDIEKDGYTREIQTLKAENTRLQKIEAAFKEFEAEPFRFIAKVAPELVSQLDPSQTISRKLKQEFGSQFSYDPTDAEREGTDSYRYRMRSAELRDAYVQEQTLSKERLRQDEEARKARLNDSKKKVMSVFKLSEEQFEKEVIGFSKEHQIDYMDVAKIRYLPDIVKREVSKALSAAKLKKNITEERPSGAAAINGTEGDESLDHLKELYDEFGDR